MKTQPKPEQQNSPSDPVSIWELARELNARVYRLAPLITYGYLRVANPDAQPRDHLVYRPEPAAMEWLRTMLMPLSFRPLMPLKQVAKLFEMQVRDIRRWCVHYNIAITLDEVFGELISMRGFQELNKRFFLSRNPARTDRQAFLAFRLYTRDKSHGIIRAKFGFSVRLEDELERIFKMPEPERSVRATEIWKCYRQASTLAECIANYKKIEISESELAKHIDQQMTAMAKAVEGKGRWKLQKTPRTKVEKLKAWKKKRIAANAWVDGGSSSES